MPIVTAARRIHLSLRKPISPGAAKLVADPALTWHGENAAITASDPTWDWLIDGMYELAAVNVPMDVIGPLVGHSAVWRKMREPKTGITNDNTPLTAPQEVAALPKLWTTAAP